ncbi:uncharacterized protein LOC111359270 [Spodoptera litura]|uniref:Uncharacterized protein LOC111359270 n=1 Tax=Spodoptera litura TaxID=69820 RepID=A0A9J7EL30_SPOLT|nr:uncharacterized protein LOC111359270 [Spodoptera litura]
MRRCCIKGCNSNSYKNEEGLSFFRFPLNECLKKLWIEKIGNENIKPAIGIAICSKHFEDHCVNRTMNCVRLKDGAIPTLFSAVKSDKQCIGPETGGKGVGELSSIVPLNKKFDDTARVRPVRSNHMQEADCDKFRNQLKPDAVSGFNEESSSDEASDSLHKGYINEQRAVPVVRLIPLSKEMLIKYSRNFEEATDTNQNEHDVDKSRVCKLCLRVDAKMYDLNDETLNMLYQYIIGIVPRTDSKDRFPMNICWECKARLHSASVLKYKALTSDQLMREYLDSHETLNITEISNLHREHNLESSLIIDSIETFNCATETHSYTKSDTLVNTGTAGSTFEEDLDDNSQIDEIDVENQSIDDDTKSEIDIMPNNSQDSFHSEAPKVNWDNIILVKAPTVVGNQFNVPVFDNNSKMADESETNDDSFDMNMDDGNEEIVAEEPSKLRTRKIKTSKNRTR